MRFFCVQISLNNGRVARGTYNTLCGGENYGPSCSGVEAPDHHSTNYKGAIMSTQLIFQSTRFNIIIHNKQSWISIRELAQALNYSTTNTITGLYNKNSDEFTDSMTQVVESNTPGNYRKKVRIFTLHGAYLIAMLAQTPVSKEFCRWVRNILNNKEGNPSSKSGQPTTADERTPLRDAVNLLVGKKGIMYDEAYRYIHQRFNITHIDELPKSKIHQAIEYLHRLALDCEHPPVTNDQHRSAIRNGRLLVEYKNGFIYNQKIIKDEDIVGPMETFEWIQKRAGCVVIRKELLEKIQHVVNGHTAILA